MAPQLETLAPKIAPAEMPSSAALLGKKTAEPDPYAWRIVWRNVLFFVYLHYASVRGLWLFFSLQMHVYTYIWSEYSFRPGRSRTLGLPDASTRVQSSIRTR